VWNCGGGVLTWGSGAGAYGNSLAIDGSSSLNNVSGLTLGDNNTTFSMTNSPGGFSLNGFTTAQLGFTPTLGALTVGPSAGSIGTALVLSNYTLATTAACTIGGNVTARTNSVTVAAGATWSGTAALTVGGANNALTVTNGGRVVSVGGTIGNAASANSNTVSVSGAGSSWSLGGGALTLAGTGASTGNVLSVSNGGVVTNISTLSVGAVAGDNTNGVVLTGGGLLEFNAGLTVGLAGSGSNTVVNQGGILQTTNGLPAIVINAAGAGNAIVMTNGTLGYRGIQTGTLPNLTNNWGATGVGLLSWQGATNAFRLDNALATNSLGRTYVFSSSLGATNYARLELVNGTTSVRGAGSVIGIASDGALLLSNTTATIAGPFTNNGAMTIVNSIVTSTTGAVINGTVTIDPDRRATTNGMVLANDLTLGGASVLLVTGTGTNLTLFTHSGARSGVFGPGSMPPPGYQITYVPGRITLQKSRWNGSMMMIR
jgi:fibronectin-binding autotransporter adhesin